MEYHVSMGVSAVGVKVGDSVYIDCSGGVEVVYGRLLSTFDELLLAMAGGYSGIA